MNLSLINQLDTRAPPGMCAIFLFLKGGLPGVSATSFQLTEYSITVIINYPESEKKLIVEIRFQASDRYDEIRAFRSRQPSIFLVPGGLSIK